LTEHNPTICAATGSNSNLELCGGQSGGKNSMTYMSKYMTKNVTALANTEILIRNAIKQVRMTSSVARDAGLDQRIANNCLIRSINKIERQSEIPGKIAESVLMGIRSYSNSHGFVQLYCADVIQTLQHLINNPHEQTNDILEDVDMSETINNENDDIMEDLIAKSTIFTDSKNGSSFKVTKHNFKLMEKKQKLVYIKLNLIS